MSDCLNIIFHSFWTWSGTVVLAVIIASGLSGLITINIKR